MAELHVVIRMDSLLVLTDEVTTNGFLFFLHFLMTATAVENCEQSGSVCALSDDSLKGVCWVGYSDFHNLMGFTSKKMPNNIL